MPIPSVEISRRFGGAKSIVHAKIKDSEKREYGELLERQPDRTSSPGKFEPASPLASKQLPFKIGFSSERLVRLTRVLSTSSCLLLLVRRRLESVHLLSERFARWERNGRERAKSRGRKRSTTIANSVDGLFGETELFKDTFELVECDEET